MNKTQAVKKFNEEYLNLKEGEKKNLIFQEFVISYYKSTS